MEKYFPDDFPLHNFPEPTKRYTHSNELIFQGELIWRGRKVKIRYCDKFTWYSSPWIDLQGETTDEVDTIVDGRTIYKRKAIPCSNTGYRSHFFGIKPPKVEMDDYQNADYTTPLFESWEDVCDWVTGYLDHHADKENKKRWEEQLKDESQGDLFSQPVRTAPVEPPPVLPTSTEKPKKKSKGFAFPQPELFPEVTTNVNQLNLF